MLLTLIYDLERGQPDSIENTVSYILFLSKSVRLTLSNWVHTHSLTFLNLESLQRSIAIIVVKKIDSTIRKVLMLLYERQRKYPEMYTEQTKFWKQVEKKFKND